MYKAVLIVGNSKIENLFESIDDLNEWVTDCGYYSVVDEDFKDNQVVMDELTITRV